MTAYILRLRLMERDNQLWTQVFRNSGYTSHGIRVYVQKFSSCPKSGVKRYNDNSRKTKTVKISLIKVAVRHLSVNLASVLFKGTTKRVRQKTTNQV